MFGSEAVCAQLVPSPLSPSCPAPLIHTSTIWDLTALHNYPKWIHPNPSAVVTSVLNVTNKFVNLTQCDVLFSSCYNS